MRLAVGLTAFGWLLLPAVARAEACDYVLQWDAAQFQSCVATYRKEIEGLKLRLSTAELNAHSLEVSICILAMEIERKIPGADVGVITTTNCPKRPMGKRQR